MALKRLMIFAIIPFTAFLNGCGAKGWLAKQFRQGDVAEGVARLSTLHETMILNEVNNIIDESDKAELEIIRSHKNDGRGEAIWTLRDVDIHYPTEKIVYEDCLGGTATWIGKAHVITATKRMAGVLTNDPKKPIIPDPHSVVIHVRAEAENLTIRFTGKEEYLTVKNGSFEFTAHPRLAQLQSGPLASVLKGFRVAKTSNTRFKGIKLKNLNVILHSPEVVMDVAVQDSDLQIQVGRGEDGMENKILGKITIFDNEHDISVGDTGLDPHYDAAQFIASYSCLEDLGGRVTYKDTSLEEALASNVARLMVMNAASVLRIAGSSEVSGSLADPQRLLLRELAKDETIMVVRTNMDSSVEFSKKSKLGILSITEDNEDKTTVEGSVNNFKAEMVREGMRIRQPLKYFGLNIDPRSWRIFEGLTSYWYEKKEIFIRPTKVDSTSISVTTSVDRFVTKMWKADEKDRNQKKALPFLYVRKADIEVKATPMMGIDKRTIRDVNPSYSIQTPVIRFDEINIKNARATLYADDIKLQIYADAKLRAFNGKLHNDGNYIEGEIRFTFIGDGKELPTDLGPWIKIDRQPLDLDYDQVRFDKGYENTEFLHSVLPSR